MCKYQALNLGDLKHRSDLIFTFSVGILLTGRRYGDRRFIKWTRFCRDSQLA